MPSEKILAAKKQVVADIVASCKEATTFVFVSARGLTVEQDTAMREELRKNDVTYKVIKNTTLRLVFKELGIEINDDMFKGPTAVAYSNDLIAPAKVIGKFADSYELLEIKGGAIEGKVADVAEITKLAKVPDKEVLYSQVVYGMLYPFTKLAMLVKAVAEKAESDNGSEATAEAPAEAPVETPAEA